MIAPFSGAEKFGFAHYAKVHGISAGDGGSTIATIPAFDDITKSRIRLSVNKVLQSMILLL